MAQAAAAGLGAERIIIDPGLGFGKTPAQNLLLINACRISAAWDAPSW